MREDNPSINLKIVRSQFVAGKTLWRSFTNERVQQVTLRGPVLDLGAGEFGSSSYHGLIAGFQAAQVSSVDISDEKNPTKVADIEQGIPFEEGFFLTCLAFNLFEHLYEFDTVLREISRVLSPTGKLYIVVPFLYRVHGDPSDYFRYTSYALERSLSRAGFEEIYVDPCGAGAMTAALAQVDFLVPRPIRGFVLGAILSLDQQISKRSGGKYRNASDYPLGYFVTAQKPALSAA